MRTKFNAPKQPDYHEQIFIEKIETYQRLTKDTLALFIYGNTTKQDIHRTIRKMIEKYNNSKYENIIPLGKIITHNGIYELIRSNHELADKVRKKARYDFLCQAIDYHNTMRILGNEQAQGQLDLFSTNDVTLSDLIREAQELEKQL